MNICSSAARHALVLLCVFFTLPLQLAQAQGQKAGYEEKKRQTNDIAVTIITSGLSCTCARFAEDMRNVVNDLQPEGLGILPVLGVGGLQNVNDVRFRKGIGRGYFDEDIARVHKH